MLAFQKFFRKAIRKVFFHKAFFRNMPFTKHQQSRHVAMARHRARTKMSVEEVFVKMFVKGVCKKVFAKGVRKGVRVVGHAVVGPAAVETL